jgi:hypothetical protein
LWKEFLIQATAEVFLDVSAILHDRAEQHEQDDAGLGELTGLESGVIAVWLRVRIAIDPTAIVPPHFLNVVIPVRTQAQCIANESSDYCSCGTVSYRHTK